MAALRALAAATVIVGAGVSHECFHIGARLPGKADVRQLIRGKSEYLRTQNADKRHILIFIIYY